MDGLGAGHAPWYHWGRMLPAHAEVAIVGGGVMGLSTAYHLARAGVRDVLLLERAEVFGSGATAKCAGGFRHQFATEINIRLSVASIRLLEHFEDEPAIPSRSSSAATCSCSRDPSTWMPSASMSRSNTAWG
jgi:glycine/D-amino acid oxidase-like deaminating enzyme